MQALFVHDHIFLKSKSGEIYSPGQYPYQTWQRYLVHFEKLYTVARSRDIDTTTLDTTQYDVSSGANVCFEFMPSLSSISSLLTKKRNIVRLRMNKLVRNSDAVIVRLPSELGLLAYHVAIEQKKPCAVELVACPWDALWNHGSILARFYAPLMVLRVRNVAKRAQFVLYVTDKFLQRRYPTNGKALGVSDIKLPELQTTTLESRLKNITAQNKVLVFGFIGNISTKIKGLDTLLCALSDIRSAGIPFQLRVLGAGDPAPWIQRARELALHETITFCGTLPAGEAVYHWLDEVDIYIHPSFQEGLSRAVIEAMSRGCPIIASTVGGTPELLSSDWLHKPGDCKQLTKLILKMTGDKSTQKDAACQNFKTAENYVSTKLQVKWDSFWNQFKKSTVSERAG